MLTQLWTYIQAHPATTLAVVGVVILVGSVLYNNWSKLKLPTTTTAVLTQREAIDSCLALQRYFGSINCSEGVKDVTSALTHAVEYHAPALPPPLVSGSQVTATITGPMVTSQAP